MLRLQRIHIPNEPLGLSDCVSVITDGYFEWGYVSEVDGPVADLTEERRRAIILRGYDMYDGCQVAQDSVLTAADVALSVAINSYVVLLDIRRLLALRDEISGVLEVCAPGLSLSDASDELVEQIGSLVDKVAGRLQKVKAGKITKVFHKKRPELIPVIDNYVHDALYYSFPWLLRRSGNRFAAVLRAYRAAQNHVQPALTEIDTALRTEWDIGLTQGRILNYLLWNWMNRLRSAGITCTLVELWGSQDNAGRMAAKVAWEQGDALSFPQR